MSMASYMSADLREIMSRDMPAECQIGAQVISVLIDDLLNEEVESYGGPEAVEMQRITFHTDDKAAIENGSKLAVRPKAEPGKKPVAWKSKIVVSSITSADGNALIATVRGD